jgi:hypothetical protein
LYVVNERSMPRSPPNPPDGSGAGAGRQTLRARHAALVLDGSAGGEWSPSNRQDLRVEEETSRWIAKIGAWALAAETIVVTQSGADFDAG